MPSPLTDFQLRILGAMSWDEEYSQEALLNACRLNAGVFARQMYEGEDSLTYRKLVAGRELEPVGKESGFYFKLTVTGFKFSRRIQSRKKLFKK